MWPLMAEDQDASCERKYKKIVTVGAAVPSPISYFSSIWTRFKTVLGIGKSTGRRLVTTCCLYYLILTTCTYPSRLSEA